MMKKYFVKIASVILSVSLLTSLAVGCGKTAEKPKASASSYILKDTFDGYTVNQYLPSTSPSPWVEIGNQTTGTNIIQDGNLTFLKMWSIAKTGGTTATYIKNKTALFPSGSKYVISARVRIDQNGGAGWSLQSTAFNSTTTFNDTTRVAEITFLRFSNTTGIVNGSSQKICDYNVGNWYNVSVLMDLTGATRQYSVYVNGVSYGPYNFPVNVSNASYTMGRIIANTGSSSTSATDITEADIDYVIVGNDCNQTVFQNAQLQDGSIITDGMTIPALGNTISIYFSNDMDKTTFTYSNINISGLTSNDFTISSVADDERVLQLTIPTLLYNTSYNITLSSGIMDWTGRPINQKVFNLQTIANPRGATIPWTTYEAENGTTNGTILGPNRDVGDPAGEASGRKAVKLVENGQYVQWTVSKAANALVVRYSIPDAADGGGINSTISVYKNGVYLQDLSVTSKYAWLYGDETNPVNTPGGQARHIYDESNAILSDNFVAGDIIKLQKDTGDTASYYIIDFIELESVSPIEQPSNTISITTKGAIANDTADAAASIEAAIADAKAQGKDVWIPQGTFYQSRKINADNVTIRGAGMWYSKLYGYNSGGANFNGDNNVGFNVAGSNTKFYDLQVIGEATVRNTGGNAFNGTFGTGSALYNIWIEHTNCGVWEGVDNSANLGNNLIFDSCRIRNTFADGINMCNGTQNSIIKNCTIRNTGDDGIAIWSKSTGTSSNSYNNTIQNCTVQLPWRAAGIGIYGGDSNKVLDNVVADTLTNSGLRLCSNFNPYPFAGTVTVKNNEFRRCGGTFFSGQQFGAIWLYACDSDIAATINFTGNDIYDATHSGVHIQCANGRVITGPVTFDDLDIVGTGKNGIFVKSNSSGTVTFKNTRLSDIGQTPNVRNDASNTFTINQGIGNTGW